MKLRLIIVLWNLPVLFWPSSVLVHKKNCPKCCHLCPLQNLVWTISSSQEVWLLLGKTQNMSFSNFILVVSSQLIFLNCSNTFICSSTFATQALSRTDNKNRKTGQYLLKSLSLSQKKGKSRPQQNLRGLSLFCTQPPTTIFTATEASVLVLKNKFELRSNPNVVHLLPCLRAPPCWTYSSSSDPDLNSPQRKGFPSYPPP